MDLTVLIPTKNEADNIVEVIGSVREVCDRLGASYDILVVDAGSSDGTREKAIASGARTIVQQRPAYGGAILDGFDEAKGEMIVTLDADFSHPPAFIEKLWAMRHEADLAIGSRFVPGGRADMPALRYALSRVLNATFGLLLAIPVRDMSSGYRMYRKGAMEKFEFEGANLSILQDMAVKLYATGHRVKEIPFHYMPRKGGKSKSGALRFGPSYLMTLLRLIKFRLFGPRKKGTA